MRIRVDNTYSDGHTSRLFYNIPDGEVPHGREAMREYLWRYTGDGHGKDRDLGYAYEVTVVDADDPALIGVTVEWAGR